MKSVIVTSALVFLTAGPVCAQIVPCKNFDRSSPDAPQFVRDYLDGDSNGLFVRVCGFDDRRKRYAGASDLVRDGNVCRYSTYVLDLLPTSPPHLERKEVPPVYYMLVSQSKRCPSPQAIDYVWTYDVPQDVFEHLVHVWHDAISSPASFDTAVSGASDAGVLRHLRNVILRGQSRRLAVERVNSDASLRGPLEAYELGFTNPDHNDRCYQVLVLRSGRDHVITDIRACWY